jgi:hypothetical protein
VLCTARSLASLTLLRFRLSRHPNLRDFQSVKTYTLPLSNSPMTSDEKPRTKLERLSLTCDACRSRHQKCNGARPLCHFCLFRGLSCEYPGIPAEDQQTLHQKRVADTQKPDKSSPKRNKRQPASPSDNYNYDAVRAILMTELVRDALENN